LGFGGLAGRPKIAVGLDHQPQGKAIANSPQRRTIVPAVFAPDASLSFLSRGVANFWATLLPPALSPLQTLWACGAEPILALFQKEEIPS
jgi:hypothetical protein